MAPRRGFFISGCFLLSVVARPYMYPLAFAINTARRKRCYAFPFGQTPRPGTGCPGETDRGFSYWCPFRRYSTRIRRRFPQPSPRAPNLQGKSISMMPCVWKALALALAGPETSRVKAGSSRPFPACEGESLDDPSRAYLKIRCRTCSPACTSPCRCWVRRRIPRCLERSRRRRARRQPGPHSP